MLGSVSHPPIHTPAEPPLTPSVRRRKLYDAFRRVPLDVFLDPEGNPIPDRKFSWSQDIFAPVVAAILIFAFVLGAYFTFLYFWSVEEINAFVWSLTLEVILLVLFAWLSNRGGTAQSEEQLALAAVASLKPSFQPQIRDVEYVIQRMESHVDGLHPLLSWILEIQPLNFVVLTLVGLLGGSILSFIEIGGSSVTVSDNLRRIFFFVGLFGVMILWLQHQLVQNHQKRTQAAREYLEILHDPQQDADNADTAVDEIEVSTESPVL